MNITAWARRIWNVAGVFLLVFLATAAAVWAVDGWNEDEAYTAWMVPFGCNVVAIDIRGDIGVSHPSYTEAECLNGCPASTSSDEVVGYLETAAADSGVKAILLNVDSYGGTPLAAEEIATELATLGIPSVAWVRQGGTSAAYWIASAADSIIASANSDVGGIGITMSYLDYADQNAKDGLYYNSISSGAFKDAGDPDKVLTEEEYALFERDVLIMHDNFVRAIATNRNLSQEKVSELADGSTMLGEMALTHGLIDRLGGKQEALDELRTRIGEEPAICWAGV